MSAYAEKIIIAGSLEEARKLSNSKDAWCFNGFFPHWLEGRCNAVQIITDDADTRLQAISAQNEIRFLADYNKRHFGGRHA